MCRNFLEQIPSLLDCPRSRQISTSCRRWFKSRRRSRSVLIRGYVDTRRSNKFSHEIYTIRLRAPCFFFSFFATGERDAGEDPVSGANVFRTINMSPLVFLPAAIVRTTLVFLKGSFRQKPLVLSLIAESWRPAWLASFASARRTVDPGGLECEKVDYARWLLHFRLQVCTRPLRTLLRMSVASWFVAAREQNRDFPVFHIPLRKEIFLQLPRTILLDYNGMF